MSEGKPVKKRRFLVSAKVGDVMAAQTSTSGKSSGNKDSPAVSKASVASSGATFQSVPSFPNPVSNPPLFGAPTYIPSSTNPWQSDNANKLDIILAKLSKIEMNQNTFLARLDDMEGRLIETNRKVVEIENSQSHISSKFDGINSATNVNTSDITKLQCEVKTLSQANSELTKSNKKIKEEVIDLKCRSMRDNMLFFGVPESQSPAYVGVGASVPNVGVNDMDASTGAQGGDPGGGPVFERTSSTASFANVTKQGENCSELVYEFCEKLLKINDPKSKIQIERAHRIGIRKPDKIRPIVAKFVLSEHKDIVKSAASNVDLKVPPYNGAFRVTDQLPQEVLERRKELIPKMVSERNKGNRASLVRDKLYVNGKLVE